MLIVRISSMFIVFLTKYAVIAYIFTFQ
jgi:hypothetical protein